MTLIEVVVAASILFIIMTGVLGLLGRTMMMGAEAKQINVTNNAVSSYIEWARSLPFVTVASIEATTVVNEEYTVTIEPTVQDGDNAALKNVYLSVTTTRVDGFSKVSNLMVVIRDRDQHLTAATRSPGTDPKIRFVSPTPPDGTAVWLAGDGVSYWRDSGGTEHQLTLQLETSAVSPRTVDEVSIWCDDAFTLEDMLGTSAIWPTPSWTTLPTSFAWNLNQLDVEGAPRVDEGLRSVAVYVRDSAGVKVYDLRQYVVDNRAPDVAPSPLTYASPGSMSGALTWDPVLDGTSWAYGYEVELRRHDAGQITPDPLVTWTLVSGYSGSATTFDVPAAPFTQYVAQVRAYSPLGHQTDWTAIAPFVTRPLLTGSYAVVKTTTGNSKGWTVTPTLSVTPPAFPTWEGSTSYAWYAGTTVVSTSTANTYTPPVVTAGDPKTNPFPTSTYSVKVTTQPKGDGVASTIVITSNAVTTVEHDSGTYTFGEGTW
ncbi:MAG: hypothetical protein U1F44_06525 [Coriobacteriia bacterium]|nr:hypothetical protein [Coriobacteriia bacterium]